MKIVLIIFGLIGVSVIVLGLTFGSEDKFGDQLYGLIIALIGVVITISSLIGGLVKANIDNAAEYATSKSEPNDNNTGDIRQKGLRQGFLHLSILRKLLVILSLPFVILVVIIWAFFLLLLSGGGHGSGSEVVFIPPLLMALLLCWAAWPTILTNFKNSINKS